MQHGEPLDELVYSEVMFSDTVSGELPEHKRFMREIGGNEHQLFGFFKCVMDHGVMVRTLEYSLPARLQQYELGEKIENYAAKHNRPMPWVV